jgi:hypothetical protein
VKIPESVSGRKVTPRGVHLVPFGHAKGDEKHPGWMARADYWVQLLQSMHMSWAVLLSESDDALTSGAAKALLDGGIIPIIRFATKVPRAFTEMVATKKLMSLYQNYDAPLIIQWWNEPFDDREAAKNWPPKDKDLAWRILADTWNAASQRIVERGAYAGFPDGPCYDRNPFLELGDPSGFWESGKNVYLCHNYGKGRPLDYPLDLVSHFGDPLSMEQYRTDLDDYADDPQWNEGPGVLNDMNQQRKEWCNPNKTPIIDDTCWLGWVKTQWYAREAFGFDVEMGLTEGGWTPRDRAGGGREPIDIRWAHTTPRMVAKKTLAAYEAPSPFFANCPWILACKEMQGSGWEDDSWVGGSYSDKYGLYKPVVPLLQQNPPGVIPEPTPEPIPEPIPEPVSDNWTELDKRMDEIIRLLEEKHGS